MRLRVEYFGWCSLVNTSGNGDPGTFSDLCSMCRPERIGIFLVLLRYWAAMKTPLSIRFQTGHQFLFDDLVLQLVPLSVKPLVFCCMPHGPKCLLTAFANHPCLYFLTGVIETGAKAKEKAVYAVTS